MSSFFHFFFYNDPATTEIYTLSLHDALPIWKIERLVSALRSLASDDPEVAKKIRKEADYFERNAERMRYPRSEEHTSELQSHSDLVCRLLLEKKKKQIKTQNH